MARNDSRILATPGDNTIALALLTLAAALPLFVFGEKISGNQGFGFDGFIFGPMAADFYGALREISQYRLQRLLPSAILYHLHLAIGGPFTSQDIVTGYVLLNVTALVAGSFVWGRIADNLGMSQPAKWLGGIALIANFASLKMLSYNPVLMDGIAFLLGLLVLHSWLRGRTLLLHALSIITIFAWQTAWIYCVPLLIFRRQERTAGGEEHRIAAVAAGALSAILFVGVLLVKPAAGATPVVLTEPYTAFKVLIACTWLALGVRELVQVFPWRNLVQDFHRTLLDSGATVLTVAAIVLILKTAPNAPNEYPMSFARQLPYLLARAFDRPGVFALCLVIYFGPVAYLALWRWRSVSRLAATMGPGMPIFLGMSLVMTLNSESRHLVFVFPFVVALTIKVMDARPITPASVLLFLALSLALSRVWLTIGNPPGEAYFMNFGPWWGLKLYCINLLLAIGTAVVATLIFR
ncbi:MAG: hypothetical protein AAB133_06600 [Pseudomonadota bacterium]